MTLNRTTTLPFSVENDELNSHHRLIFELIDKVEVNIAGDHEAEVVTAALMALRDYASYHFGAEEALFEIQAYPEAQAHTEHHLEFRAHLSKLMALTERGEKTVRLELIQFLRMWIRDHVMLRDKDYIPYLRDKTLRKAG
jgi:hemerythrin-like metal-binding protein